MSDKTEKNSSLSFFLANSSNVAIEPRSALPILRDILIELKRGKIVTVFIEGKPFDISDDHGKITVKEKLIDVHS